MNGKPWTADCTATLKRMAGAGYTDGEIARHLGFCRETVTRRRLCLGYTSSLKLGRTRRIVRNAMQYGAGLYPGYDGYEIVPNEWERAALAVRISEFAEVYGIPNIQRRAQSA